MSSRAASSRTVSTFQLHLVLTLGVLAGAFCLTIGLSIFVPLAIQLGRSDLDPHVVGGIGRHALDMHATFWPMVLVCLAGSVAGGMLLYRRMTSPLIRFLRAFEEVRRGEVSEPIVIRKRDYLNREADALNQMLSALATRAQERDRVVEKLLRVADDLPATASLGIESTELLRELRDLAKALR